MVLVAPLRIGSFREEPNITLDSLINQGKAKPMFLVSRTANGNTQGTRGAAAGFSNFTRALIEEILPQVEKSYNASTKAADHAIAGQSAGGAEALLLINRTYQFQLIGGFSPGFDMYHPAWGTNAAGRSVDRQRALLSAGQLETTFPAFASSFAIKLLYVSCDTDDVHLNEGTFAKSSASNY
jgi:enterochelin esterase-like enzyme